MAATPPSVRRAIQWCPSACFSLIFPDDCRVCEQPLTEVTRIPVCKACLAKPEPLLAEFFCTACRTPFLSPFPLDDHGLCGLCRLGANGFDAAYSFGSYQAELRKLIHLFKYSGVQTLDRPLGRFLSLALPRGERFDALVPMPMHWLKRWHRGFNQAELLANQLSGKTRIPVLKVVRRVHQKAAQAGLTNAKRRANVVGAFRVPNRGAVAGKRILLIDDVMTTGATASACAKVLKRAGAVHVSLLTVARVDRRMVAVDRVSRSIPGSDALFPELNFS